VRRFVALLFFALMVCACDGTHLAGTHDVELEYEVRKSGASVSEAARRLIEARLGAAHIPADVEASDATHVRVRVDEDSAPQVDEMLSWRGGLAVYRVDPAYGFVPKDHAGLTPKTATAKDGTIERYFVGSRAHIARAIHEGNIDEHHRVLIEAIDQERARTRVVHSPALVELRDFVDADTGIASEKRELVLYLADVARLRMSMEPAGAAPTLIALGQSVLSHRRIADLLIESRGTPARAAIVLPVGDTITAFARAHNIGSLLRTGTLPPLARTKAQREPTNWPIAVSCLVVPMLLSIAWLFFVRRFDPAHPEPWWLVLATFALGGLSVAAAGFAEWAAMSASPYLNPSLMTLGGQISAFPLALAAFTLVVGLSEEGSKLLGTWSFACRRREFDEPVDGIIYGAASSLGFAAVENIKYFAFGRLGSAIIVARTFTSIPAHLFFGAIWGYALGRKLVSKKTSILLFLAWSALMHGAFDTFLSIDGLHLLALALNLVLASLFIVLLRRALRHGAVNPDAPDAPPSTNRLFFPVGRPAVFATSAVFLHLFAAILFLLGAGHQAMHQRVTYAFVAISSSLVAVLGLAAYALAATMPLDVAVDEHGITFAGRAVAWSAIRGVSLLPLGVRGLVRLGTDAGVVSLGPGRMDRMQSLEQVIKHRLAERAGASGGAELDFTLLR